MATKVIDDAIGKDIVDANGNTIGIVNRVDHGTAYVDPDPGITDEIKARLGWEDTDEADYPLQEQAIASFKNDEIRLRDDL